MSWTSERARVAALSRSRTADDPELLAAHRDLKATRLEQRIREVVDAAPPLTDAQRNRLASLLLRAAEPAAQHPRAGAA